MTTILRMTLGATIRRVTAFQGEQDMLEAMRGGYCPTLRVKDEPMGVEEGRDNHAVRRIRKWVLDGGFSYFDGSRVIHDPFAVAMRAGLEDLDVLR